MPEPAATQILATKVVGDGLRAARVELTIADATTLEDASESVVLSVNVELHNELQALAEYQRQALHRAIDLLQEQARPLDKLLERYQP